MYRYSLLLPTVVMHHQFVRIYNERIGLSSLGVYEQSNREYMNLPLQLPFHYR